MLRLIVAVPFLLLLVLFALSNAQPVRIGIWPTDYSAELPLSVAVLIGAAIAFLFGALIVWWAELGQRRRARRAEAMVRVLEEKVEELKARLGPPVAPPR